jgi:hypothetical protein
MRLAYRLVAWGIGGRTVAELGRVMDADEFMGWAAYMQLEPRGTWPGAGSRGKSKRLTQRTRRKKKTQRGEEKGRLGECSEWVSCRSCT